MGIIAKNDNLFFDALAESLATGNKEVGNKIQAALTAFMMEPKIIKGAKIQALRKNVQAVGVSTDFAQLTADAFNVTIAEENFDLGYERSFREVPLGTNQDFWQIYDVQNGLTFRRVEEGQRIRVEELSGSVITAYVDYYGGALGWTDKMIRYRKVAAMVDMAMIFRNRFWANKADNHYALLAAAAGLNVTAWAGAAGDTQLQRDIQTINLAAFTLVDRCKDKGYFSDPNVKLVMYANPRDKGRLNAAFRATTGNSGSSTGPGPQVDWNIELIYTLNANVVAGSPILVLPLAKIQRADDMQPTTFTKPKDALTLNEIQAVWAIYGAIVGDSDQCEELTLG